MRTCRNFAIFFVERGANFQPQLCGLVMPHIYSTCMLHLERDSATILWDFYGCGVSSKYRPENGRVCHPPTGGHANGSTRALNQRSIDPPTWTMSRTRYTHYCRQSRARTCFGCRSPRCPVPPNDLQYLDNPCSTMVYIPWATMKQRTDTRHGTTRGKVRG